MIFSIDLSGNFLYGGLPPLQWPQYFGNNQKRQMIARPRPDNFKISSLFQLNYLNLSGNFLDGEVPGVWGGLTALRHLDLSNNQLENVNVQNLSAIYNAINGSCDLRGNVQEKICLGMNSSYSLCQTSCLYYWCSDTMCQKLEEPNEILAYIRVMTSSCRQSIVRVDNTDIVHRMWTHRTE